MEEKTDKNQYLYITEEGVDDNESIVRALRLPVCVIANIDGKGVACIELRESQEPGKFRFATDFEVFPNSPVPQDINYLVDELQIEKAISIAVSEWITIYLRDGVFCTDSKKETLIRSFDLRDVSKRLSRKLDEIYTKYHKNETENE